MDETHTELNALSPYVPPCRPSCRPHMVFTPLPCVLEQQELWDHPSGRRYQAGLAACKIFRSGRKISPVTREACVRRGSCVLHGFVGLVWARRKFWSCLHGQRMWVRPRRWVRRTLASAASAGAVLDSARMLSSHPSYTIFRTLVTSRPERLPYACLQRAALILARRRRLGNIHPNEATSQRLVTPLRRYCSETSLLDRLTPGNKEGLISQAEIDERRTLVVPFLRIAGRCGAARHRPRPRATRAWQPEIYKQ